MSFSEVLNVSLPSSRNVRFFPEDIGVGPGFFNHARIRLDSTNLEKFMKAHALYQFAEAFTVPTLFRPPVPYLFNQFFKFIKRFFHLHKRYGQCRELGALQDRGLSAKEDGGPCILSNPQGPGHGIDAMHATVAFPVVDPKFFPIPGHAMGRTELDHLFYDMERTTFPAGVGSPIRLEFSCHISLHRRLIDTDIITPGPK